MCLQWVHFFILTTSHDFCSVFYVKTKCLLFFFMPPCQLSQHGIFSNWTVIHEMFNSVSSVCALSKVAHNVKWGSCSFSCPLIKPKLSLGLIDSFLVDHFCLLLIKWNRLKEFNCKFFRNCRHHFFSINRNKHFRIIIHWIHMYTLNTFFLTDINITADESSDFFLCLPGSFSWR